MLAQLIPDNGGPPITITRGITVVGRSSRFCDLALDDTNVSKMHCILVKTDGLIYMRDLGSTNGTRVNGQRVVRGALLPGDRISFSGVGFRVYLGPDPQLSAGSFSSDATLSMRGIDGGTDENMRPLDDSMFLPAD